MRFKHICLCLENWWYMHSESHLHYLGGEYASGKECDWPYLDIVRFIISKSGKINLHDIV